MAVTISAQQKLNEICRKKILWDRLVDYANYPAVCSGVNSIRILEKTPFSIRSEWFVTIGKAPFSWMQVDTLHSDRMEIRSEAVSGDFGLLNGLWKITDMTQGAIQLSWRFAYELDVPVVDVHYGTTLQRGMQAFADGLVAAHIRNAAAQYRNERIFKRVFMDCRCSFSIDGRIIEVQLVSFSRGGIRFNLVKGMLDTPGIKNIEWQADSITAAGRLMFDSRLHSHRVAFNRPLSEKDFKELFFRWSDGHDYSDELITICEVVTSPATGIRIHASAAGHS